MRLPSPDCAIGDVHFGMTSEEIYKTSIYRELMLKDKIDDEDYFQNPSVCATYGIYDWARISFMMEDDKLKEVRFDWEESLRGGFPFYQDDDDEMLDAEEVLDRNLVRLKSFYGRSLQVENKRFVATSKELDDEHGQFSIVITQ